MFESAFTYFVIVMLENYRGANLNTLMNTMTQIKTSSQLFDTKACEGLL